jgi:hypothetical protein
MSRKFCLERTIRLPYATQRTTEPEDAAKKNSNFKKKFKVGKKRGNLKFQVNKKKTGKKNLGSAAPVSPSRGLPRKKLKIEKI